MTTSRKRLIAALAFVLPVAALVAAPAAYAATPKHHTTSVHKTSAHKTSSHKAKHIATPSS